MNETHLIRQFWLISNCLLTLNLPYLHFALKLIVFNELRQQWLLSAALTKSSSKVADETAFIVWVGAVIDSLILLFHEFIGRQVSGEQIHVENKQSEHKNVDYQDAKAV